MANTKTIGSPLSSAFNNIVNFVSPGASISKTEGSFNSFLGMMNNETRALQAIKLPKKDEISKLANLNIASTFGNVGNLLSSIASGALDVAGFVGNFFGRDKEGNALKAEKPLLEEGSKLKFGGLKAIGITNAIFAGLDFATGLAQGESVGQSAASAGGALAGGLLGGVIGETLIPVPPLGFIVGNMVGDALGRWAGNAIYDATTGTGGDVKSKEKEKLKQKEREQRTRAAEAGKLTLPQVMDKFDAVVNQFARLSQNIGGGGLGSDPEDARADDVNAQDPNYKEPPADGGGGGGSASGLAKAASDCYGMTSADNPVTQGGRVGCVWAVNKVYKKMGANPPWGGSLYVPDAVTAMKKSGYSTVERKNIQSGDIYIAPNEHHIGIVLDNNTILSNSSTRGSFSWKDSPEGYAREFRGQGTFYRPNFTQAKAKQEQKVDPTKEKRTTTEKLVQDTNKDQKTKPKPITTPKSKVVPTSVEKKSQPNSTTVEPDSKTSTTQISSSGSQTTNDTLMAMVSAAPPQTQQLTSPSEISQYTTYNQPTVAGQSVIIPIMMGSNAPPQVQSTPQSSSNVAQSSGSISGPTAGDVLNRFIKTAMFTNLETA